MKLLLKILLVSLPCLSGFSQNICKGVLLDKENSLPIEFANIGIIGKGIGTVSNEKGEYALMVPDSLLNEPVKISIIGYNSETLSAKDFQKRAQLKLSQNITSLSEVAVSAKKTKVRILGNETKTRSVSAGFKNNSLGAELGIKIRVNHPQTHLRKVMFNITRNSLDKAPVFRLNVYATDKKGSPAENILKQNIIISPSEKTGYIEFDLSPYSIFLDDDVIVSLEWIKDLGDAKGLYFSTKLVGSSIYFRQTSQAKWEKVNAIGVGLHVEAAY